MMTEAEKERIDHFNTLSLAMARLQREKDILDQQHRVALSIIHSIKDDAYRNGPVDIDTIQEIIEVESEEMPVLPWAKD